MWVPLGILRTQPMLIYKGVHGLFAGAFLIVRQGIPRDMLGHSGLDDLDHTRNWPIVPGSPAASTCPLLERNYVPRCPKKDDLETKEKGASVINSMH